MKFNFSLFTALLFFLSISVAQEQPGVTVSMTGEELVQMMEAYERTSSGQSLETGDLVRTGQYVGFLMAVGDAVPFINAFNSPDLCVRDLLGITGNQIRSVVSKYLRDNPQRWHQDGLGLAYNALALAFPC